MNRLFLNGLFDDFLYFIKGANLYNSSNSSTFIEDGKTKMIQYGKGRIYGVFNFDTVTLAGFTIQKQSFIETVSLNGLLYSYFI